MNWTGLSALACAAALAVACSSTGRDDSDTPEPRSSATVGTSGQASPHGQDADARYLADHAAMAGNAEVELGELAGERAQNPQVKEFAQMMVRDHSEAGAELKKTLAAHDVAAPSGLDPEHRQLRERLSSLSGADFDREYMKAMVEGHKEVKSLLEGQGGAAHDPRAPKPTGTSGTSPLETAVRQWAGTALPRVSAHLQKAEEIYAKVR